MIYLKAIRLCILRLLALTALGCSQPHLRKDSEVILFSVIALGGVKIFTVGGDGSSPSRLFQSQGNRHYIYASGNSLKGPLVVLLREINSKGEAEEQLYLYQPGSHEWQRLTTRDGYKGPGVLSPNNLQIAFTLSPKEPYGRHRIWLADAKTGETLQLTSDTLEDRQSWDQYLAWHPDGHEIAFLRARLVNQMVVTSLQAVSSTTGQTRQLLLTDEPIAGFCYSPTGDKIAAFTSNGLEVIQLQTETRTTLMPWTSTPDRIFRASGMIWSPITDAIAFALFNSATEEYELWTVPVNGTPPTIIYKEKALQILVSSFLQP